MDKKMDKKRQCIIDEIKNEILKDKGMRFCQSNVKFHTRKLTSSGFFLFSVDNWDSTRRLWMVAKYEPDHPNGHKVWIYCNCDTQAEARKRLILPWQNNIAMWYAREVRKDLSFFILFIMVWYANSDFGFQISKMICNPTRRNFEMICYVMLGFTWNDMQ